jgi:hypothetical protein
MPIRKTGMILLVLIIGSILVGIGFQRVLTQSSFNIIFRYGCNGGKNILNTFNGTFIKDMLNYTLATSLTLTQEELNQIYSKMKEVGLFSLNQTDLKIPSNISVYHGICPLESYYLKVQDGTRIKELSWNRETELNSKLVLPFSNLVESIKEIVHSHPEFRKLPDPVGGYF